MYREKSWSVVRRLSFPFAEVTDVSIAQTPVYGILTLKLANGRPVRFDLIRKERLLPLFWRIRERITTT
jgi:hypothetical protein